jgi:hypothetical protein
MECLGLECSVSADEFRALLRNFNLEASAAELSSILAACRPLAGASARARTPGGATGDASGLPRLDCRRFMDRLKGLDHGRAAATPLSGATEGKHRRTAMKKLRTVILLRFGTARQKMFLGRWTNPKPLGADLRSCRYLTLCEGFWICPSFSTRSAKS